MLTTVVHADPPVQGLRSSAVITLLLLAMATFVAYMRHRVLPVAVSAA
jgi:hypothetical protein